VKARLKEGCGIANCRKGKFTLNNLRMNKFLNFDVSQDHLHTIVFVMQTTVLIILEQFKILLFIYRRNIIEDLAPPAADA
jgi:hypothetical protein